MSGSYLSVCVCVWWAKNLLFLITRHHHPHHDGQPTKVQKTGQTKPYCPHLACRLSQHHGDCFAENVKSVLHLANGSLNKNTQTCYPFGWISPPLSSTTVCCHWMEEQWESDLALPTGLALQILCRPLCSSQGELAAEAQLSHISKIGPCNLRIQKITRWQIKHSVGLQHCTWFVGGIMLRLQWQWGRNFTP